MPISLFRPCALHHHLLHVCRVHQVSCGPFHAAAISDDGCLYTWGDGLFGKLGHGDHESCSSPRQVAALSEHWTISVSCGWWHSAAAAVPRGAIARGSSTSISSSVTASSSYTTSGDGSAVHAAQQRRSSSGGANSRPHASPFARVSAQTATPLPPPQRSSSRGLPGRGDSSGGGCLSRGASSILGDVGGGLFTWGGDFTWQQRGKRDNHEGCLGLGDLAGRLVPTIVKGEDDIKQVGWLL
jgi:hypothetical protein